MRTRPRCIGLWLNDAEHEHLMRQCAATGLTANAYIRKRMANGHEFSTAEHTIGEN